MGDRQNAIFKRLKTWMYIGKTPGLISRVDHSSREGSIAQAAAAFGLDADNPSHRETLLAVLADALFPSKPSKNGNALIALITPEAEKLKPRGAPEKWGRERINLRAQHIGEISLNGAARTARERAAALKDAWPEAYKNIELETLAGYLTKGPPTARRRK